VRPLPAGHLGDEIKAQARGESPHGAWTDRLYAIAAVRLQPKVGKDGKVQRYKSGARAGEVKTGKVQFFRPPNDRDLAALAEAERRLKERWDAWEQAGLIPTEELPEGSKTCRAPALRFPKMVRLVHTTAAPGPPHALGRAKSTQTSDPRELGEEMGLAVVTYLQFAIDKGLDYNSRQTRWEYTQVHHKGHTFGRHDFSLKWTFGEMVLAGPSSGLSWCLSQIYDAYKGIADLVASVGLGSAPEIYNGAAAHLARVPTGSVDLVCMDPPYYNNVQYAELSDYFYVWQKRTLAELYPDVFARRLTNKTDEAVANPARDGSMKKATTAYERMMKEIFGECARVLRDDGIVTIMFTHKSQDAWEALTRSLIDSGWILTAAFPVESEGGYSTHLMDTASAASSIFLTCRKRLGEQTGPATWTGFGGAGVQRRIREAVSEALVEFEPLDLNPVDEMVASYGRALRVLSEQWPVLDGDEEVSPLRAMNEASAVVAEHQIRRITEGRLRVDDLAPEAAMALTLFGIYGLAQLPYDEALNLSRSLNLRLEAKSGNYRLEGRMIGINQESAGRRSRGGRDEDRGYAAPLVRKGSKLRLARPEERDERRLEAPQTEWDVLCGLLLAFREGDVPVARAYLERHAQGRQEKIVDLAQVWAAEAPEDDLRKEARALLFGLRGGAR
jgi:putative DNA methylase